MARGRTVDSDAFGSGPCGGRGRGRSTCGRGGTIPPPSSLSSSEPRKKLSLVAGQQIIRIIKLHLDKDGYTWDAVPQEARDFYWEDFQAKKYGREPTPMELFTYTHTKDHDGNTFVDTCALGINVTTSRPQPDHSAEEIIALRARIDEQERQLPELRAHVMRMSGQPGAGTSSSDPPPTTDRDVSTALRQPLPSPLNPDIADDTLVTPTDTTTHPVDTPPGATTLDRADDQCHRFDFGPF
ncbi:hypothetical protein JCGZ_03669 [Jatropha curcas]|uniref:Uncharacterized protein n=1 Tax=Jatropha curcas TaxID=180498 RepID=A0A067JCJ4_JATCU|nr:hypothetical protein JCGZ_03669 [Jatropha curcas]